MKKYCMYLLCLVALFACFAAHGAAETSNWRWTDAPEGIREALGEELSSQSFFGFTVDLYDENQCVVLVKKDDVMTLCFVVRDGEGKWTLVETNSTLITYADYEGNNDFIPIAYEADDTVRVYSIGTDADAVDFYRNFTFKRNDAGDFSLVRYHWYYNDDYGTGTSFLMEAREDGYRATYNAYNKDKKAFDVAYTMVYDIPDFLLKDLDIEKLNDYCTHIIETRNDAPDIPAAKAAGAFAEPLLTSYGDVYTGPSSTALTANEGWAQVFGREGDWLLIQHNIGDGRNRFGYVKADTLPIEADVAELLWEPEPFVTTIGLTLTDDPLRSKNAIALIPAGTAVQRLASFGDYWAYVEVTLEDGKLARGFVMNDFIAPETDKPFVADEARTLADYWLSTYDEKKEWRIANVEKDSVDDFANAERRITMLFENRSEILYNALQAVLTNGVHVSAELMAREYMPVYFYLYIDEPVLSCGIRIKENKENGMFLPLYITMDLETCEVIEYYANTDEGLIG